MISLSQWWVGIVRVKWLRAAVVFITKVLPLLLYIWLGLLLVTVPWKNNCWLLWSISSTVFHVPSPRRKKRKHLWDWYRIGICREKHDCRLLWASAHKLRPEVLCSFSCLFQVLENPHFNCIRRSSSTTCHNEWGSDGSFNCFV